MDYYKILNVSRKATLDEIKKMYRQLALLYHPDKNNSPVASTKFNEVAEAYLVLRDEKRREIFDTFGEEGVKTIPLSSRPLSPSLVDTDLASNLFADVFGGQTDLMDELMELRIKVGKLKRRASFGSLYNVFPAPFPKRQLIQDPPIYMDLRVTLEEIYAGCTKKLKITKQVLNPDKKTFKTTEKILHIDIKPGSKEGTTIIFPKEGDEKVGVIAADVVFVLKDLPHALYNRDSDNNLIYTKKVNLRQALVGDVFEIPTLTPGRTLSFNSKDVVIEPKFVKIFHSEGLPLPNQPGNFGNLLLNFDIIFPERVKTSQKNALKEILP